MIESALIAIPEAFSCSVASRTRRRRAVGRHRPDRDVDEGRRHAVADVALLGPGAHRDRHHHPERAAPASARRARSQEVVQPPGHGREHDVVDGAAERVLDLLDPLERRLGDREPAGRADLARRTDPRAARPCRRCARRPARVSTTTSPARRAARPRPRPSACSGWSTRSSHRVADQVGAMRAAARAPTGSRRRAERRVGIEVEERRRRSACREMPSAIAWCSFISTAVRPSREALEHVELPQRLRRGRADARARGRRRVELEPPARATGSPRGGGGSRGRTARRRPRAAARGPHGTRSTRWRSRGARCSRASTTRCTSS